MKQPRIAVVFASYIAGAPYLDYCRTALDIFHREFCDADFYVGINPCPLQAQWIDLLTGSGLPLTYAATPAHLALTSDASAYQTALSLFHDSAKTYDLVWFAHTKGATSHSTTEFAAHLIELFLKKEEIVHFFISNPGCGLYAASGVVLPRTTDAVARYMPFRYPPLALSPIYTFYVMRGSLLHAFLRGCDRSFFTSPMPHRHFFEFEFPQIVFRQGYQPHFRQIVQVHTGNLAEIRSNEKTAAAVLQSWAARNRIGPKTTRRA